ncbi:ABC transporter permease [Corynebacterium sp.]|uniref:ABC transporter permease n=1 Tax=Corynebacterium sp. TaxID=1720 RepID=UPI003B3AF181
MSRTRRPQLATVGWLATSLVLVVVVWQVIASVIISDEQMFPGPATVLAAARTMFADGYVVANVWPSLTRVLVGFTLGAVGGVVLGIATGRVLLLRRLLGPVLILLRPVPAIALVPVAIVWFGIGEESKYAVIAYAVGLTVWLNTHAGAEAVPETYLRAARSLGVSRPRQFLSVVVPAASPFIVTGLRLGASVAFISLIAAELTGASAGIGFQLQESRQYLATDAMFVSLITLGVLGAAVDLTISSAGHRLLRWEKS